jgi:zinc D-Ala-D-Ala dipeptidase
MTVNLKEYGFATEGKVFVNKSVVEALLKAKELLPPKHNFKIWSGKRTLSEQRNLVIKMEKALKKKFPKNWNNLLRKYTGGYEMLKIKKISFMNHLSGNAIDLTILNNKKELNMGKITYSEKDNINYYKNLKKLTAKEKRIRENRELLKKVMRKTGFKVYNPEWWHWGLRK